MAIARISDIRGLVTIGGEGEEILKIEIWFLTMVVS